MNDATGWTARLPSALVFGLGCVLIAASLLNAWSASRYALVSTDGRAPGSIANGLLAPCEAAFALMLVARLWPRKSWFLTVVVFGAFAIYTAIQSWRGKTSCGCFGEIHVKPVYTMWVDALVVVALLAAGRPSGKRQTKKSNVQTEPKGGARKTPLVIAVAMAVVWLAIVLAFWLTRPMKAVAAEAQVQGEAFGKAGELVVLEPEKWAGQRFTLGHHIDVGKQLTVGKWIVLLVHHDCDHCAAAVPRYVGEMQNSGGTRQNESVGARLAVIEMPPFGGASDPPPWQLPPTVLTGRLDQARDWFATTPVALLIKDGIVISGKDGDQAETPDLSGWKP